MLLSIVAHVQLHSVHDVMSASSADTMAYKLYVQYQYAVRSAIRYYTTVHRVHGVSGLYAQCMLHSDTNTALASGTIATS